MGSPERNSPAAFTYIVESGHTGQREKPKLLLTYGSERSVSKNHRWRSFMEVKHNRCLKLSRETKSRLQNCHTPTNNVTMSVRRRRLVRGTAHMTIIISASTHARRPSHGLIGRCVHVLCPHTALWPAVGPQWKPVDRSVLFQPVQVTRAASRNLLRDWGHVDISSCWHTYRGCLSPWWVSCGH